MLYLALLFRLSPTLGNDVKVLCLTKNFNTQTPSGGYDQIVKFLSATQVARPTIASLPMRIIEKGWSYAFGHKPYLFSHLSHGYHFEDRLSEEQAFWRALMLRPQILHVLYGDWMLDALLRRKRLLSSKLVATFHLPAVSVAERFERVQKDALEQVDGAVLLATNDLNTYSTWLRPERVVFIPHGVDTATFRPAEFKISKTARFIFIGMMLRDFDIAHRVIDRCYSEKIDAEFVIVIGGAGKAFFTGCSNAKILSNISEQQLITLYRSCDALFLPLLNSTANNAILEALACGLPVISTRIGGVPDYVDESCGWLLPPSDFESAYECVREIVWNRELAFDKRKEARLKAEGFSWNRVANKLLNAYGRLCGGGHFGFE